MAKYRKKKLTASSKKDLGFQLILLAWPVFQFLLFYIYVNINSVKLAFNFDKEVGNPFVYFASAFNIDYLKGALTSVALWAICSAISIPLALIFAYYIYKKFFGSKFFRFMLFLPSIISATVLIVIFKKFTDIDFLVIMHDVFKVADPVSITSDKSPYAYVVVIGFYLFVNFGTTTLIYSNKMSEIPVEVSEAARLDGVNQVQEFFHIALPGVWPTLSTFIVTGIATMFTNQYCLFTFFSSNLGKLGTGPLGYIIYNNVQGSFLSGYDSASIVFHKMAALGLLATLVIIPLVFGAKYLLKKVGPSEA